MAGETAMSGKYVAYPEYKDSGVEWLGDTPSHWGAKPLKFLCTYNDEVLADSVSDEYEIEYVDIGSVSATEGIMKTESMVVGKAPSRAQRIVRDGDVIVSTVRTYLEAIAPVDNPPENLIVSTGFAVIRPNRLLDKRYAAYCLRANGFIKEVVAQSVGISYPAINASDLANIKAPEPAFLEQQKIANFLDHETVKIDTLIEKQQQLIKLLKEKRQAVISHAVTKGLNPNALMRDSGVEWLGEVPEGWEACRVKQISNFITSGPRGWSDFLKDNGDNIFLQSGDLNNKLGLRLSEAKKVSPPNNAEGVRTKLEYGDVVVCITGANTGRVAITPVLADTVYINQHLSLIRPLNKLIDSEYLGFVLSSSSVKSYFSVTQYGLKEGLSLSNVGETPLCRPPLVEQKQIAQHVKNVSNKYDALEVCAEKQVELLRERRTALISAAVTGKIDVRNWVAPEPSSTTNKKTRKSPYEPG